MFELTTYELSPLVSLRYKLRLKQREVADWLGISRTHFCNIESGARGMSFDIAFGLSKLYGVSLETLYAAYVDDNQGKVRRS